MLISLQKLIKHQQIKRFSYLFETSQNLFADLVMIDNLQTLSPS